ncbi:cytochrome c oxidase subunit 4 [Planifilum fulgidum]|uniref:Cytochrome c oxidase subunit 4 n=1 Tax=Planifilum fulgidum TaxID=201973 RepID=A0A1I2LP29_9BACL|nr:cytochrome C oxidase subunit IV family protein [Planifilum fulgidum]MBO2496374.1 cytochrome-c oxidase [Bacillota bacterium]MBO2531336.1 cytochrome-c oxidase [Thermoactinomycetaceae bacterium]SFF78821.1 cytochrome c oxidase subunit 4 [Planifilum fulgidum]
MEPKIDPSTARPERREKPESAGKHVKAFALMMILTAAAFILVGTGSVAAEVVIPVLLLLASVQVVVQLFTFMHLDQKGSFFPVLFVICGIVGAIVCILALTLWV